MRLIWNSPFGRKTYEGTPEQVWEHVCAALFWNVVNDTLEDIASVVL